MDPEDLDIDDTYYRSPLLLPEEDDLPPSDSSRAETTTTTTPPPSSKKWRLTSLLSSSLSSFSGPSNHWNATPRGVGEEKGGDDEDSSSRRRRGDDDGSRRSDGRSFDTTMASIVSLMVFFTVVMFLAAAFMPDTSSSATHHDRDHDHDAIAARDDSANAPPAPPLRVYILAGQSNMEGHANVSTIEYIGDDPGAAPLLDRILGPDGSPREASDVWIAYCTDYRDDATKNGEAHGKLSAGYGYRDDPAVGIGMIGPEYAFGLALDDDRAAEEEAKSGTADEEGPRGGGGGGGGEAPALIIKTAWGGKSLDYDFRSPSSGPYPPPDDVGGDDGSAGGGRRTVDGAGHSYRLMIAYVRRVLSDPGRVTPAYDPMSGYALAGFVWFQGWNDLVDNGYYAGGKNSGGGDHRRDYSPYTDLLASFVRDVRVDLDAPDLPFVVGTMGVDGDHPSDDELRFREAEAAIASVPEFVGNVVAVRTAPFWDDALGAVDAKKGRVKSLARMLGDGDIKGPNADGHMTAEDQRRYVADYERELISPEEEALWKRGASAPGYHYLGCAKIFARIGEAFAEAVMQMKPKNRLSPAAQLREEA